jgi:hypothetical protein
LARRLLWRNDQTLRSTADPLAARAGAGPAQLILAIVEAILSPWCDRIQLNTTQAIEVHPQAPAQVPHRDQDMWRDLIGEVEYLVNVMWPLTRFTRDNGATRIWPGTHGGKALVPEPDTLPVAIEMEPGSALLFLGSALHGAGANNTAEVRRGWSSAIRSVGSNPTKTSGSPIRPRWRKPSHRTWRAGGLSPASSQSGNFEGQCPSVLLTNTDTSALGAQDTLRPDQQAMVEAYVQSQTCTHPGRLVREDRP